MARLTPEQRAEYERALQDDDAETTEIVAEETAAVVAEEVGAETVAESAETAAVVADVVAEETAAEVVAETAAEAPAGPTISERVALINAESAARVNEIQAQALADIERIRAAQEAAGELAPAEDDTPPEPTADEPPPPRGHGERFRSWWNK